MSSKQRRSFTAEFKIETVRLMDSSDRSVSDLALELGIHENTLHKWRRKYTARGTKAFPGNGVRSEPMTEAERQQRETEELRRELERVRMERDILKKALNIVSHL